MTIWSPTPRNGDGPFFVRLADGIEAAIAEGTLADGAKLPPQRDLAYDLGVTVGTVGRAYALLRERGLASGEVGRGTYVRGPDASAAAEFRARTIAELAAREGLVLAAPVSYTHLTLPTKA